MKLTPEEILAINIGGNFDHRNYDEDKVAYARAVLTSFGGLLVEEVGGVLAALRELVALKDMKDEGLYDDFLIDQYHDRKGPAWDAARAALAAVKDYPEQSPRKERTGEEKHKIIECFVAEEGDENSPLALRALADLRKIMGLKCHCGNLDAPGVTHSPLTSKHECFKAFPDEKEEQVEQLWARPYAMSHERISKPDSVLLRGTRKELAEHLGYRGPEWQWQGPPALVWQEGGLPETTQSIPVGCRINQYLSRVCERGTKSCEVYHG